MCPHCESSARATLAGMARAGVGRRRYARARRELAAALRADNEPAVRRWLVEHEPSVSMGRASRSERQAARASRQQGRQQTRAARQSERASRQATRQSERTTRTQERVQARGERAEERAERREIRQEGREERRELRGDRPQFDLSRIEQTGGEAVSWLRDQARDLFGGGGGESQTQVSALEQERKFPVVPVVLGVAVLGGGAYYFATRKKSRS